MGKKRKKAPERSERSDQAQLLNKLKCLNMEAKQFVVGCNALLRSLEKDQLALVMASRNVNSLLLKPISMLCSHHDISLLFLEPQELADLNFKVNTLTAFGIKKITAAEDQDLQKLIQEAGVKNTNINSAKSEEGRNKKQKQV